MSVEQVVSAVAATVCIIAAVIAVTRHDPRASGAALMVTLLSLAVLYAGLGAPVVAAVVILVTLFVTLPLVVHLSVTAAGAVRGGGPVVSGAAVVLGIALLGSLAVAIALGEVPMTIADRSSDGYALTAVAALLTGRSLVAAGACVALLVAAGLGARAARRGRWAAP